MALRLEKDQRVIVGGVLLRSTDLQSWQTFLPQPPSGDLLPRNPQAAQEFLRAVGR